MINQQPPRKTRKWPWVVGGIVALLVVISAANGGGKDATQSTAGLPTSIPALPNLAPAAPVVQEPAKPTTRTVVYRVSGTAKKASSITYTTDGMTSSSQESDVPLPWERTLTLPADGAFQIVSVLAQGSGKGRIDVTITVDGQVIKEAHADGYGVASANENIGSLG
jgi:hypothetical protein